MINPASLIIFLEGRKRGVGSSPQKGNYKVETSFQKKKRMIEESERAERHREEQRKESEKNYQSWKRLVEQGLSYEEAHEVSRKQKVEEEENISTGLGSKNFIFIVLVIMYVIYIGYLVINENLF